MLIKEVANRQYDFPIVHQFLLQQLPPDSLAHFHESQRLSMSMDLVEYLVAHLLRYSHLPVIECFHDDEFMLGQPTPDKFTRRHDTVPIIPTPYSLRSIAISIVSYRMSSHSQPSLTFPLLV